MGIRQRWLVVSCGALVAALVPALPAFAPCHIITFENDPYTIGEGAGKVTITLSDNGGQGTPTVDWETANDTAKAPGDFTAASGTVQFVQGESEATFEVTIKNDTTDEPAEQFKVRLSNESAGGCIPPPEIQEDTAVVTISDNDPAPEPTQTKKQGSSAAPKSSPASKPSTPSPMPTVSTPSSPSPAASATPVAQAGSDGGGLSGGALAGIIAAIVVLGGAGAFWVRRRFLA